MQPSTNFITLTEALKPCDPRLDILIRGTYLFIGISRTKTAGFELVLTQAWVEVSFFTPSSQAANAREV